MIDNGEGVAVTRESEINRVRVDEDLSDLNWLRSYNLIVREDVEVECRVFDETRRAEVNSSS